MHNPGGCGLGEGIDNRYLKRRVNSPLDTGGLHIASYRTRLLRLSESNGGQAQGAGRMSRL